MTTLNKDAASTKDSAKKDALTSPEPVIPTELHARNATVLKTVEENLRKVCASFIEQANKEGADPDMVDLLEQSKAQLEGIRINS